MDLPRDSPSAAIASEETHLLNRSADLSFYGDLHHRTFSSSNIDTPKKTGFLDLSAELRNKIYYLALVADGRKIKIGHERYDSIPNRFTDFDDEEATGRHPPGMWLIEANGRPLGSLFNFLNIQLLRTCRKINAEATPIFYGANCFVIPSPNRLRPFCKATIRHVRFLRIQDDIFGPMFFAEEFVRKLETWTSIMKLEKLEFAWDIKTTSYDDSKCMRLVAKKILPLVKEIQESKSLDIRATVDIIELFAGEYRCGTNWREHSASLTEQLRAEILRLHAAADEHGQDKAGDSSLRSHSSPTINVTTPPDLRTNTHAHVPAWEERLKFFIVWDLIALVLITWVVNTCYPTWQEQLKSLIVEDIIVLVLIVWVASAWSLLQ